MDRPNIFGDSSSSDEQEIREMRRMRTKKMENIGIAFEESFSNDTEEQTVNVVRKPESTEFETKPNCKYPTVEFVKTKALHFTDINDSKDSKDDEPFGEKLSFGFEHLIDPKLDGVPFDA